jgi:hypothetical protein
LCGLFGEIIFRSVLTAGGIGTSLLWRQAMQALSNNVGLSFVLAIVILCAISLVA